MFDREMELYHTVKEKNHAVAIRREVEYMKKLLIIIGAVCYVAAPDLFFGPVDDAVISLASTTTPM